MLIGCKSQTTIKIDKNDFLIKETQQKLKTNRQYINKIRTEAILCQNKTLKTVEENTDKIQKQIVIIEIK